LLEIRVRQYPNVTLDKREEIQFHQSVNDLIFSTAQRFIEFLFNFYQSRVTNPERLQGSRIALESMAKSF
jgi:hypothetical protein